MPVLFLFIAIVAALAYVLVRERSLAKAAGMSDATPVCGGCQYRLGGWSSPTCPECGTDVRRAGVRTGPRSTQIVLDIAVLIIATAGVLPAMASVTGWLLMTKSMSGHGRYESTSIPGFFVTLETEYTWQRWPPRCDFETSVTMIDFMDRAVGGSWHNGRYVGPAERREQTVGFDHEMGRADDARIEQAARKVIGPEIEEDMIVAHVRAIESLVETTLESQSRGELDARLLLSWTEGPLRNPGNGGAGGHTGTAWPGILASIVPAILFGWVGIRIVHRRCRSGWRLPREGEWERAAADTLLRAGQRSPE